MTFRSHETFREERVAFRDIERIFWEAERDYPFDAFGGVVGSEDSDQFDARHLGYPNATTDEESFNITDLGRGSLSIVHGDRLLEHLGKAAEKSDDAFASAVWEMLGIDVVGELDSGAQFRNATNHGDLAALTAEFGTEAFATYCPWHAFGESKKTPWGIYMFPEKIIEWARFLYLSGQYLPNPKPAFSAVLRFLWASTYRHELFHFHVELFATRLESALRHPVYRPYVENVRVKVAGKRDWLEEALAQAVVLQSTWVKKTLRINKKYMETYVIPYFLTFPAGYRDFACSWLPGGVNGAHRLLSAQIARARTEVSERERTTDLAIAKHEYRTSRANVPGYILIRPDFRARFQLQTPRLRDVERYLKGRGMVDEHAPGDHKRVKINGHTFHLNRAKRGNGIDLASAKAMAKALGVKLPELTNAIR